MAIKGEQLVGCPIEGVGGKGVVGGREGGRAYGKEGGMEGGG